MDLRLVSKRVGSCSMEAFRSSMVLSLLVKVWMDLLRSVIAASSAGSA